jgi:hypothetical protein
MNTTLENIRKHSSKLQKLIEFNAKLQKTELIEYGNVFPIVLSNNYTDLELLKSFLKDVEKTSNHLKDSQPIINSIYDGEVLEFDSDNNSVEEVFENTYNESKREIILNGVPFSVDNENKYSLSDLKDLILEKTIGVNNARFNSIIKLLELQEQNKDNSTENKILKLIENSIYDVNGIKQKIKNIVNVYSNFRNNLPMEEKTLIDREITFNRGMIDTVIQSSTYINKEGIKQLSSSHKNDTKELENLEKILGNSSYISDIEIDQDTDIKKISNVITQLENLNLNLGSKITFKSRKMGNYNVDGAYYPSNNIVAIDYRTPSSIIHEITHSIDLTNISTKEREDLIKHFSKKIEHLKENKNYKYISDPSEIIARLGEIAFRIELDKNNIKLKESDIRLVEERSDYSSNEMYFDYPNFTNEEELMIENFYSSFFRTSKDFELKDMNNFTKIDTNYSAKETGITKTKISDDISFEKSFIKILKTINKDNIQSILTLNKEENTFDEKELTHLFMNSISKLGNHKSSVTESEWIEMRIDRLSMLSTLIKNYKEECKDFNEFKNLFNNSKDNSINNDWINIWEKTIKFVPNSFSDFKYQNEEYLNAKKINKVISNFYYSDLREFKNQYESFFNEEIKTEDENTLKEMFENGKIDFVDIENIEKVFTINEIKKYLIEERISPSDLPNEISEDLDFNIDMFKNHSYIIDSEIITNYIIDNPNEIYSIDSFETLSTKKTLNILNTIDNKENIKLLIDSIDIKNDISFNLRTKEDIDKNIIPLIIKHPYFLEKLENISKSKGERGIGSFLNGNKKEDSMTYIKNQTKLMNLSLNKSTFDNSVDYKKMKKLDAITVLDSKETSIQILTALSKHPNIDVKEKVMNHPNVSNELLEGFLKSTDSDVRYCLSKVENLPKNILMKLSTDERLGINIIQNKNVDEEVFDSYYKSNMERVEKIEKESQPNKSYEMSKFFYQMIHSDYFQNKLGEEKKLNIITDISNSLNENINNREPFFMLFKEGKLNERMLYKAIEVNNNYSYEFKEIYKDKYGEFDKDKYSNNNEVSIDSLLKLNDKNKELLKESVIAKEDSKLSNLNSNNNNNEKENTKKEEVRNSTYKQR